MDRIYQYRMTTTSGGNISIRDPSGAIWITPARLDKGSLDRADVVLVHPDGTVEGGATPSSELPVHQAIYAARRDLRAIIHAHPVALVAFSIVHDVPSTRVLHQAHAICGQGGFAPYRMPGSPELGTAVAAVFTAGHDCVILENHGVVTAGRDLAEAFRRFETFEFTGKTIIKSRMLAADASELSDADLELARTHAKPLAASDEQPPTTRELELRATLQRFVRRGYRQRLFISSHGTFSARLDACSFVLTPHLADRAAVEVSDLVVVRDGRAPASAKPSYAARLHEAIYRLHPNVGAIINAAPVNATAFGIAGCLPDTRTIPESRLVLRELQRASFTMQFSEPEALAGLLSEERPIILLANDGVLVTGRTILEAFDRLEVLESTAEALINARSLGELAPLGGVEIDELEAAFFQ
jgi:L-fuculose-phosphate aldolase